MGGPRRDERRFWLSPGVRGIGAASLLSDLGQEVSTSLLPRLLTSTLGAPAAALGLIEGLADALGGLMRLAGGALADDPGRRRAVAVGGYATTAVVTGLIGAASAAWQVGVLRAAGWAARGLRTPSRNALLADAVAPEHYGRAFGFERAMDNAGAVGGPLLALALVSALSVRAALLLAMVPGLLAAASIVYAVRHLPQVRAGVASPVRIAIRPVLRGPLRGIVVAVALFEVGNVAGTLLILRATELLAPSRGLGPATQVALLLYLAYNVAAAATSVAAGHLSDRAGPLRVLAGGFGAFLGAYLLFAAAGPHVGVLGAAFVAAGVGIGCVETAEHAAVAAGAPAHVRGSAFGLLAAVQSFGNLAASAVAGLLWSLVSPTAAFVYVAAWMSLALIAVRGPALAPPGGRDHLPGDDRVRS